MGNFGLADSCRALVFSKTLAAHFVVAASFFGAVRGQAEQLRDCHLGHAVTKLKQCFRGHGLASSVETGRDESRRVETGRDGSRRVETGRDGSRRVETSERQ